MGIIDWVKRHILGITYEQIAQDAADYTPRYLSGSDKKFLDGAQKVADAQDNAKSVAEEAPVKFENRRPKTKKGKAPEVKQYIPDLSSMTKKALIEFANGKGISVDGRNKKATILADIQKSLK